MTDSTLILGGIRSGKSRLAERLAHESALPVTYIATATADDAEMQARIEAHKLTRPDTWQVVEEPLALANTLRDYDAPLHCLLVDCLTLWLTNLLLTEDEQRLQDEIDALLATLPNLQSRLLLVSNETNMGIVPLGELSRRFCDNAGRLHQLLAADCDNVILTIAGLPQVLKGQLK